MAKLSRAIVISYYHTELFCRILSIELLIRKKKTCKKEQKFNCVFFFECTQKNPFKLKQDNKYMRPSSTKLWAFGRLQKLQNNDDISSSHSSYTSMKRQKHHKKKSQLPIATNDQNHHLTRERKIWIVLNLWLHQHQMYNSKAMMCIKWKPKEIWKERNYNLPSDLITWSAHSFVYFFSFIGHRIAKSVT